jgi:uncharacterized protein YyaL (SSP411 family)
MIAHLQASEGGFFDTSDDHEALITRPRDLQDGATPSGNAMAVTTLLKLAGFTNDLRYVDIAHQALAQMQPMMSQYPLALACGSGRLRMPFRSHERLPLSVIPTPPVREHC